MQASSLIQYLPQHGPLSSEFIPGEVELPEHWMAKFLPFNFLGVPTWGNAQLTLNVQRDFLLTALNMTFNTALNTTLDTALGYANSFHARNVLHFFSLLNCFKFLPDLIIQPLWQLHQPVDHIE